MPTSQWRRLSQTKHVATVLRDITGSLPTPATFALHCNMCYTEIRNSSTLFTRIWNLGEALQIFRIPVNSVREFLVFNSTVIPDSSDCGT